jgi:hypothetical protein
MAIVKMHGVSASHYVDSVFARKLQIRYSYLRDSGEIVKPFSQDINKMPMDFATLEPSGYSCRLLGFSPPACTVRFSLTAPGRLQNLYNLFTS